MSTNAAQSERPRGPGRPPKGDKVMKVIAMRLTDEQIAWLEALSANLGGIGVRPTLRVVVDHARRHGLARPSKGPTIPD